MVFFLIIKLVQQNILSIDQFRSSFLLPEMIPHRKEQINGDLISEILKTRARVMRKAEGSIISNLSIFP